MLHFVVVVSILICCSGVCPQFLQAINKMNGTIIKTRVSSKANKYYYSFDISSPTNTPKIKEAEMPRVTRLTSEGISLALIIF